MPDIHRMPSTRCTIIQNDENGIVTVERFYDSPDMKWAEQMVAAISEAICGLLLPRHNGTMAEIAASVGERMGESPRISEEISDAEEAFLEAAGAVVAAWESHDAQYDSKRWGVA